MREGERYFERGFFTGFALCLVVLGVIALLVESKPVLGVDCSFTTADAPEGAECVVEAPGVLQRLLTNAD